MPHYRFTLTDGDQTLDDVYRADLPSSAAAHEEALRFASRLTSHQRLRDVELSGWRLTIVDDQGCELDAVPLVPA